MRVTRHIVTLDVRDMLRRKEEPFETIMSTVDRLEPDDVFELHATFRPEPLLRVLGRRGFHHSVLKLAEDHFVVQFYREAADVPFFHLDNRGLQPPEPMMRTLEHLENRPELKSGDMGLEIWNERVPAFLLPELDSLGFTYEIDDADEAEATVRVKIRKET